MSKFVEVPSLKPENSEPASFNYLDGTGEFTYLEGRTIDEPSIKDDFLLKFAFPSGAILIMGSQWQAICTKAGLKAYDTINGVEIPPSYKGKIKGKRVSLFKEQN